MAGIRLAVIGDPLSYTLSPVLHRAGLRALGLDGDSIPFPTPPDQLGLRLEQLAEDGFLGLSVTVPHKEATLGHLSRVSEPALRARSVNTVGFSGDGWWGETTDGSGFCDLLTTLSRHASGERVLMLGAGGAARAVALALAEAGSSVTAWARDPARARAAWQTIPDARLVAWESEEARAALAAATLVVQATPVRAADQPIAPERVPAGALAVDLNYAESVTPWVAGLRAARREAIDGLGMLVHQARRSLTLWLGDEVPIEPLERAVGWPR